MNKEQRLNVSQNRAEMSMNISNFPFQKHINIKSCVIQNLNVCKNHIGHMYIITSLFSPPVKTHSGQCIHKTDALLKLNGLQRRLRPLSCYHWPFLLTWFNFNPSMDK